MASPGRVAGHSVRGGEPTPALSAAAHATFQTAALGRTADGFKTEDRPDRVVPFAGLAAGRKALAPKAHDQITQTHKNLQKSWYASPRVLPEQTR
ncbi:hypothetical protein BG841_06980 [Marinobacter sp. X15-166B]|nr:hypothetical protein BG841_06980 [Marinobacter sp. X15-166B]